MAQLYDGVPGVLLWTNGTSGDLKKGDLVAINDNMVGVLMVDIADTKKGDVDCTPGAKFRLKKEVDVGSGWTAYGPVYLDAANPTVSGSITDNQHAGIGLETTTDGATEGFVMINIGNNP
jgi:hypothetical protein